ncbi:hypothetical protein DRQ36_08405 [bacterium]|nr:MAG: hypothetical protein DRQ36_08405 [bacterium]
MKRLLKHFARSIRIPVILLFAFAFSVLLVAQRVYLVQLTDRTSIIEEKLRSVRERNDELESQIAQILESERFKEIAKEDYGLRSQRFGDVVILTEPEKEREDNASEAWEKVRLAVSRTWEAIVIGPLNLDKHPVSGSM